MVCNGSDGSDESQKSHHFKKCMTHSLTHSPLSLSTKSHHGFCSYRHTHCDHIILFSQIKHTIQYLYKPYIIATVAARMATNMTTTAPATASATAATKKMKFEEEKKIEDDNDNDMMDVVVATKPKPIVNIKNMNFSYDGENKNIIGLNCCIEPNSKIILVGANGAGKSTLLRILTGQIFMGIQSDEFDINGRKTANDQANGIAYLGGTWKRRRTGFEGMCPYQMDCAASEMMEKWQNQWLDRRNELVKVLGINLNWRMHECSDGQRKKVRIMIKLLRPFQLCIIDEFAADLDIFSRSRFFNYLTKECKERGASVVYATHIFDQADTWATHAMFMQLNKTLSPIYKLSEYQPYQDILARTGKDRAMCPMYVLVLEELEHQYRKYGNDVFQKEDVDNDDADVDHQGLLDIIMNEQSKEIGGDHYETERAGDQTGWVSGRLTRQLNAEEQLIKREERMAITAAAKEKEEEQKKPQQQE